MDHPTITRARLLLGRLADAPDYVTEHVKTTTCLGKDLQTLMRSEQMTDAGLASRYFDFLSGQMEAALDAGETAAFDVLNGWSAFIMQRFDNGLDYVPATDGTESRFDGSDETTAFVAADTDALEHEPA